MAIIFKTIIGRDLQFSTLNIKIYNLLDMYSRSRNRKL